jgi:hypothetical protein
MQPIEALKQEKREPRAKLNHGRRVAGKSKTARIAS